MYIVDRIENNIVIVEHGDKMLELSLFELPEGIREGSVLRKKENGRFVLDNNAQKKRSRKLKDRFSSMLE